MHQLCRHLVSAIAISAIAGCGRGGNAFVPPPPPTVTVAHPVERVVTRYLEATGDTEAYEAVDLRARVPGFLQEVRFKPGSVVKKDDVLFVIDRRTYEASAAAAAAAVTEAEAQVTWTKVDFERADELRKTKVTSQFEYEEKKKNYDVASAKLAAAEATLRTANLDLEFCDVKAPINGRVTKNFVDVGNLVGAGGQATVLATIVSSQPTYVTLDTSEADLMAARQSRLAHSPDAAPGQIAPGQWRPVSLATAESDAFNIAGRIDYVDPFLSAATGTVRVRCRFENEDGRLLPGMFVRARVELDTQQAVVVPDIALLSNQSGRYAFVVNDKNVVEVRQVKIGTFDGTMRVVESGLSPSDRIVVNGLQRARPGITVVPTLQEFAPATKAATAPSTQPAATLPS